MTRLEILLRRIEFQKQWLWLLMNLSDKDLQLSTNQTKQEAIDEALEKLNFYLRELKKLRNEK